MSAHDHLRVGAIEQADAYLSTHRKSETWRLIDRLRDELVRASSELADEREADRYEQTGE